MPPYFTLAFIWSLLWVIFFIFRKAMRGKMLVMSLAVIPFAFFDYYSQPSYWHPQTLFSIPIGIESFVFGFSFGGVAAAIYSPGNKKSNGAIKYTVDIRNLAALSPVLIISIGLYILFNVNIMIGLPLGLMAGCILIATLRRDLVKKLMRSALYFGLLYVLIMAAWLQIFPQAQQWWDLKIYGNSTFLNVPLGELLFGFLFGAFWGTFYEFVFSYKLENNSETVSAT